MASGIHLNVFVYFEPHIESLSDQNCGAKMAGVKLTQIIKTYNLACLLILQYRLNFELTSAIFESQHIKSHLACFLLDYKGERARRGATSDSSAAALK
jgi:hypothetical protein